MLTFFYRLHSPLASRNQGMGPCIECKSERAFFALPCVAAGAAKKPICLDYLPSDSSARIAPAYSGVYGVSKIATEGLARIMAEKLEASGKNRVNILIPGPIDSPLHKKAYPGVDNSKLPTIDSLAPVYLYLFGPQSIGVNGQMIDARTFHL